MLLAAGGSWVGAAGTLERARLAGMAGAALAFQVPGADVLDALGRLIDEQLARGEDAPR